MASRTRCKRAGLTVLLPLITAETVAVETPASRATSCMVIFRVLFTVNRFAPAGSLELPEDPLQNGENDADAQAPDQGAPVERQSSLGRCRSEAANQAVQFLFRFRLGG